VEGYVNIFFVIKSLRLSDNKKALLPLRYDSSTPKNRNNNGKAAKTVSYFFFKKPFFITAAAISGNARLP
jgi:hypothetical protein